MRTANLLFHVSRLLCRKVLTSPKNCSITWRQWYTHWIGRPLYMWNCIAWLAQQYMKLYSLASSEYFQFFASRWISAALQKMQVRIRLKNSETLTASCLRSSLPDFASCLYFRPSEPKHSTTFGALIPFITLHIQKMSSQIRYYFKLEISKEKFYFDWTGTYVTESDKPLKEGNDPSLYWQLRSTGIVAVTTGT